MTIFHAIILAIVEGLTEFLPVSSTGHMILTAAILGIEKDPVVKVFEVAIQFGAILAVVALYFKRFLKSFQFYIILLAGFIPTAVLGLLLKKKIDQLLENVTVVASSLLLGGVVLLFIDRLFPGGDKEDEEDKEVDYRTAALIGFFQSISMVPGVSRSAATIIGGLSQGLSRRKAAEFSFFLAVPTMFAATAKSLWDEREILLSSLDNLWILLLGNVIAFIVAYLAMDKFVGYLTRHGFKVFGYYRIAVGALILILLQMGVPLDIID